MSRLELKRKNNMICEICHEKIKPGERYHKGFKQNRFYHRVCTLCRSLITDWRIEQKGWEAQAIKSDKKDKQTAFRERHVAIIYRTCADELEAIFMSSQRNTVRQMHNI